MMKRNLRKQIKNTIISAALVCTIVANSISPSFAVENTQETVAGQEEAPESSSNTENMFGGGYEQVEDSAKAQDNADARTHTFPDGENVVGEFDKLKKTAEALKGQLEGKEEKFTFDLSMDTDVISQYREATWPAVKAEILEKKGIEDDPDLPDERSDAEILKDMILESLFLLDEVDKAELEEGQTREAILRDELVKSAGQDFSGELKQEFSILEVEAEEIEPETIDTVFYTSLYFTVKYEQDTDGKEKDSEASGNETEGVSKSETTVSSSEEKSNDVSESSSAEKSTVFSRGLLKSGASLFSTDDPETDVTINFITADFVSGAKSEDGRFVWTPTNQSTDHMFVFRVNYSISGVGDIAENEFQITIPKQILRDKAGNLADYYTLSIPQKDDTLDDTDEDTEYAFREEGDNLVVFNCKEITAAQNGYFDIGYSTTEYTYQYMDMADSDPFVATLNVDGKSATTDEIPVVINTTAVIQSTQKYYPDFYREWQSSWGTAPADAGDYFYLVWMIGTYINTPTQEYNFSLEDSVSSEYGTVEVAGYRMSGRSGYSMDNTVTGLHSGGYRYDYVLTRHPKAEFQDLDFYQIDNKVTATVDPADGVDADTSAVSSRSFQWSKPTFTIPTGHFNIWKYGNENWHRKFGYYWDYASYELDKLQKQEVSSLDHIKYYVEATGYPYPWTLEKGKYSDDPEAYGKNPVTYTIMDDTLYLVDEDDTLFKSEDYEEPEDLEYLVSEDYDFEYLTYSVAMTDAVYNEEDKKFDLSTHPKNDQDILIFYIKADGEWKEAGTVNLGTGVCNITDEHVSALTTDRIDFNEGVDGYRVETTNAYWNTSFYIYPYVSLKGTESVLGKVQDKDTVLLKNVDNLSVTYDGNFDGNADEEIVNISKVIGDRLRRIEKSSNLRKDVVSTSNNVRKKYYDIGWRISEEEIMTTGKGEKSYIYQNGGIFYDLLPEGCSLNDGTVAVETEQGYLKDSAFSYELTADYNNSGRTLLTVRIKPQAQYYRVYFHTKHPWDSIKDYGPNVVNPVAYETGNEEITNGYPDNGGTLAEPDKTYMTDLDKATDDNRFLYAKNIHWINALTAAISGLDKKVMTAKDSDWSYSTMTEPDGTYMYRCRFANNFTSSSKDLVFFDSLENYKVNGVTESEWHGTLQRIDLTQLKLKGIEPVVYLSSVEGLELETNHDLTDSSVWVRMEDFGDIQDAKAVAIDMRKMSDGTDFELKSGESVTAVLYMKAPSPVSEDVTDYPKTYNNIYISDTVVDQDGGEFPYFIHQDYTTVKYRITGKFSLEKVSEDDADEKLEGISFRLSGTSDYGTEVNLIKETDQDGWIDFKDIEKGTYVLQEYGGVPDWLEDHTEHEVIVHSDSTVTIDDVDYTDTPIVIINKPRIHTDVSFLKKDLTRKTKSLEGAKFKLSGTSDYGNEVLMYATSDENGKVVFENVELGTFELKEVEAPEGYVVDADIYTVVVDENANFSISNYQKTESSETVTKYSHTPNISDDGTQNSNYSNSMSTNEVVKMEGAESLNVKIVYGGESANYDWVCMWQGDHSDYTAYNNHSSSVTGKLGGTANTKEYDVEGDTVTFGFRSDGSGYGDGYGYYAVITGEVKSSFEGMKSLDTDKKGNLLFYNEPLHSIRLVKKSSYDGNAIGGATFQLKGVSNNGTTVDLTDTSGTNGFVDFTGLEAGSYTLVETKAPNGFRLDETKRIVTISKTGEVTIEGLSLNEYGNFDVVNQMIPEGQVTVIKKWKDNLSPEERVLPVIHIAGEEPEIIYTGEATIGYSQWSAMRSALSMTSTAVTFQQSTEKSYVEKIKRMHPNARKVDDGTTDKSIYVWKDDMGNFYWWTDAEKAYLTEHSGSMFAGCSKLTSLDLTNFDTSSVASMQAMFYGCSKLTNLDLSSFDTSNVTDMGSMFYSCGSLTSLDLANFDTSSVTSMNSMFSGCRSLTNLDLANFDTLNMTDMRSMFYNCNKLTNLDVSNFNTSNVTSMGSMFCNCGSLTSLDISNFDTSKVTDMNTMFCNCGSLTSLDISNFDTSKVTDMNGIFSSCNSLTNLDVANFDTSSVTDMDHTFYGCSSLTSLDVTNFNTSNVTNMYGMFYECSSLTSLDVTNFNTSNVTNMYGMFYKCKNLTSLNLTHFDTSKVTSMYEMFSGCSGLTSLDVSSFDTSKVTNMGDMFQYCSCLTGLDISNFDTSKVTDTSFMFEGCNNLTNLDVSSFNTSNVTSMCYMFSNCSSLTSLDVSNFDTSNVTRMDYMFCGCGSLTSLDLANFDTLKVRYMFGMFSSCTNLTTIYASDLWTTANVTSSRDMFLNCTSLPNFDSTTTDATNAHYNTGGYLTYKPAPTTETSKTISTFFAKLTNLEITSASIFATTLKPPITLKSPTSLKEPEKSSKKGKNNSLFTTTAENLSLISLIKDKKENEKKDDFPIQLLTKEKGEKKFSIYSLTNSKNDKDEKSKVEKDYYDFSLSSLIKNEKGKEQNKKDGGFALVFENVFRVLEMAWNEVKPIQAQAATVVPDDAIASGTSGTCTWYISADGELVIGPTEGDEGTMASLSGSSSGAPWSSNRTSITSARFEGTVHGGSNCGYMFYNCSNMVSLDLTGFDTSKVTNMGYMFESCSSLTSLDLADFDTSSVTNMSSMFYYCSSLTSLDVSNFNTSSVTDMYSMFHGCSGLTSLDVSGFDTSKVTSMGYMFYSCSSLTSLDVSGFDTSGVTSMNSMFSYCSNLTSLDVSGFDTSSVTDMFQMFSGCSSLTSLDVSGFDTSGVTSMGSMFSDCSSLTSLDVSNFDTSSVTSMSSMFFYCSKLTSLDVSGFDTSKVTSMSYMFRACRSLTSLDVSGFDTSKVTYMDHMFRACRSLTSLDVSGFDTSKVTYMDHMFSYCSKLSKIKLGENFSFKGNNITSTSSQALLPTPSPTGTEDGSFTGNWTMVTPYNHADAVTATTLRDTYDGQIPGTGRKMEKHHFGRPMIPSRPVYMTRTISRSQMI